MATRTSKSSRQASDDPSASENAPSGREQWQGKPATSIQGGPSTHLEIETKLEIGADTALPELSGRRALTAMGLHAVDPPVIHELDAVYFDTEQLDLLRSKLTLRCRSGGDDAGWHLKLPAGAGARTERGLPLESAHGDPLKAEVPPALMDLVQGASRGRRLRPIARIRNRRTVQRLLDASGTPMIEVADDRVAAAKLVPSTGQRDAEPDYEESAPSTWRELEVEVLGGDRDQLAAVVGVLRAAGARPASSASKLARALDVVDERPARRPKAAGPTLVVVLGKL